MKVHSAVFLAATAIMVAADVICPDAGIADPASPAPVASAPSAASAPVVDTKNFAFVPATLTVEAGDTVTFENSDSSAHTVTAVDKSFDSGNMSQGATWSHIFKKAGTYAYLCAYHTYMTGTIVVK